MPGFQSTQLATEGALEPFFFLYTDDSIQGNPETCKQSSIMLNYEVKNNIVTDHVYTACREGNTVFFKSGFYFLSHSVTSFPEINNLFLIFGNIFL